MKMILQTILLMSTICSAKTLKINYYISQYGAAQVTYGVLYPDNYDSTKSYPVLYAEGGVGEKTWFGSTEANWRKLVFKGGMAIYEVNKSAKKYEMIVVSPVWPFSPGEPYITEIKNTERRYGAMVKELMDNTLNKKFKADLSRIYLTGLSEGGGDVWECLAMFGNRFAAAVPIACWNPSSRGTKYTTYKDSDLAKCGAAVLQISGDNDPAVGGVNGTNNMAFYCNKIKSLGLDCDIVVSTIDGHNAWISAYQNTQITTYETFNNVRCVPKPTDIYEWLLSKKRTDTASPIDTASPKPVTITLDTMNGNGWNLFYIFDRSCDSVNYDWGNNAPVAFPVDKWRLRTGGYLIVPKSGNYTFFLTSDDGSKLTLNGNEAINNWGDHAPKEVAATFYLEAGVKHTLVLDYYEATGNASLSLKWLNEKGQKVVIPKKYMYKSILPN